MIQLSVESQFVGYSNYDTVVMCGGFDVAHNPLYVESSRKEEGANTMLLSTEDAHHIEVIIYFIPLSTPKGKNREIVDHPPFEAKIAIKQGERSIYNQLHAINAWGGAAIKLNLEL